MTDKIKEQIEMLELYNSLKEKEIWCSLEFSGSGAELTLFEDNLKIALGMVRTLGVHKLEKKHFINKEGMYAIGANKTETKRVTIFPNKGTFEGCKIVKYKETVIIPATEAKEAIPEHTETVEKTKIVCGEV